MHYTKFKISFHKTASFNQPVKEINLISNIDT